MAVEIPTQVYQLQAKLCGDRYAGASVARTRLIPEDAGKLCQWTNNPQGFLVMMGRPGCGKTYICAALLAWMYGKVGDVYYFEEAKFFEKIRASFDMKGDYRAEIEYQCDHDLLILDDIGSTGMGQTGWRQEVIFEIIDLRQKCRKPTVFSTNYNNQDIKEKLGPRAHSRLMASENTIIDMFSYPDLRLPM